jgi:hypothetical protein
MKVLVFLLEKFGYKNVMHFFLKNVAGIKVSNNSMPYISKITVNGQLKLMHTFQCPIQNLSQKVFKGQ